VLFINMSSVDDFCDSLFGSSPRPQGEIDLSIDIEKPSDYFEVLLLIMTNGMKRWYGPRINIGDISAEHIERLQEYFLSFGMLLKVDIEAEPDVYMIDNKMYLQKTRLDEMMFVVANARKLYKVHFAFAPGREPRWTA
jgi:hypothetical protein